ncbi:hypothetical protein DFH06DRAFT_1474336, partial [Mycena polygramma]
MSPRTRTVFFRPPPWALNRSIGLEWMPCSETSQPFHPEHAEIPPAATVERQFQCSDTLDSHLLEFHQSVKPLLTIPSFDDTSICTLYIECLSDQETDRVRIADFRGRTTQGLVAHFRALPPDAAKLVVTAKVLCVGPGLDDRELVKQLVIAHIFSMRSELIELRAWTAVCLKLFRYSHKRNNYVRELQRRHPPDHRCPPTKPRPRVSPVLALKAPHSDSDSDS